MSSLGMEIRAHRPPVSGLFRVVALALAMLCAGAAWARPVNDDIADAIALSGESGFTEGDNQYGTAEPGEPPHAGKPARYSVWFRWVAPSDGLYDFSTCAGTGFDTVLAAYTGEATALVLAAANDNWCGTASSIRLHASAGVSYLIAIDGSTSSYYQYRLSWEPVSSAPPNDDFEDATVISGLSFQETGYDNRNASAEFGEPSHRYGGAESPTRSLWYRWTAPEDTHVVVETCLGSEGRRSVSAYEGDTLQSLSRVVSATSNCFTWGATVTFDATAGSTYSIAVDSHREQPSNFRLTFNAFPLVPLNDDIANAEELQGTEGCFFASVSDATAEPGEPSHGDLPANHSLWYHWVAPADGAFDVSTCLEAGFPTALAAYTGSIDSLSLVTDGSTRCQSGGSTIRIHATQGEEYWIALDAATTALGYCRVDYRTVTSIPSNDNFEDATVITGLSYQEMATNVNASLQPGEPRRNTRALHSIWYKWTAPSSAFVGVGACNDDDLRSAPVVYTGDSLETLRTVVFSYETCNSGPGAVAWFRADAGTTYYISADIAEELSGSFLFTLDAHLNPANDNIAEAAELVGSSGSVRGGNQLATAEPGEPAHAGFPASRSLWYKWVAPEDGLFDFSTCRGTSYDTVLAAYTGTIGELTAIAANNNWCGNQSSIRVHASAGTTYWIAVDGPTYETNPNYGGFFQMDYEPVLQAPPNDDFEDATVISGLTYEESAYNTNASTQLGEQLVRNSAYRTIWFRWTAPSRAYVKLDICEGDYFGRTVAVYTGEGLDSLTSHPSSSSICGYGLELSFDAEAGETYYFVVDGLYNGWGTFIFSLNATLVASNDNIADAVELQGTSGTVAGDVSAASAEPGEPAHAGHPANRSVWYRWVAPEDGVYQFSTCNPVSEYNPVLAAYTGTVDALDMVATNYIWCDYGTGIRIHAVAGTTYWIAADAVGTSRGAFQLDFRPVTGIPPNDDFADATVISGLSYQESVDSTKASAEFGEPAHGIDFTRRSVWYRWTAPTDTYVVVDTCTGPNAYRYIAVYTGENVDGLTRVGSTNSGCGVAGATASFDATAGVTYHIAVDTFSTGNTGTFRFSFSAYAASPNDDIADAEELVGLSGSVIGNNYRATIEEGEPYPFPPIDAGRYRSLWYHWVPPESGYFEFDTCSGTYFHSVVAVYSGTTEALRLEKVSAYGCGARGQVRIQARAGVEYWIAVSGYYSNSLGIFQLTYSQSTGGPPNDHYLEATLIEGVAGSLDGTTRGSVTERIDDVRRGNRSVWYRLQAPHAGRYRFDTCGRSTSETFLRFLTIDAAGEPVHVAWSGPLCGRGSDIEFDVTEGEEYFVEVVSEQDADFTLAWQFFQEPDAPDYTRLPSRWYFAEGVTYPGFDTYVLLHNPNDTVITVALEMLFEDEPARTLDFTVDAKSRKTINLNNLAANKAMALALTERDGHGFVADRSVYTLADGQWIGAHAVTGVATLSGQFYFAEGASSASNGHGDHYQTFFLLANPGDTAVDALVTYYPEPGTPIEELIRIEAHSRRTLEPAKYHPGLSERGFATQVRTLGGGIVAERAMWWRDSRWNPDVLVGGSASAGIPAASRDWYFAEPGRSGQREFLLLLNPNDTLATFEFGLQLTDGKSTEIQTIAPNSRRTIELPAELAASPNGVHFHSDLPLIAERSTYRDYAQISPVEGDSSSGATAPSTTWLFAEGACFGDFDTTFALANPGNESADVWLTFHRDGASAITEIVTLEAGRSTTVRCGDVGNLDGSSFSTEVISTAPIMAERTIVFGQHGEGGTTSAGVALDQAASEVTTTSMPQISAITGGSSKPVMPTPTPTPTVTPIRPTN
ncbi:hypothetical protein GC173_15935 [bacterium]|nr:hypothetical protein [bacterium]